MVLSDLIKDLSKPFLVDFILARWLLSLLILHKEVFHVDSGGFICGCSDISSPMLEIGLLRHLLLLHHLLLLVLLMLLDWFLHVYIGITVLWLSYAPLLLLYRLLNRLTVLLLGRLGLLNI